MRSRNIFASVVVLVAVIGVLLPDILWAQSINLNKIDQSIEQQRDKTLQSERNLNDLLKTLNVYPILNENIPPRIYLHIRQNTTNDQANTLRLRIESITIGNMSVIVPRIIQINDGPSKNQLRFFRKLEAHEAMEIKRNLDGFVNNLVLVDLSHKYENSDSIRSRHYELWLEPNLTIR